MVDGLKGFPQAIAAVYPDTVVQTCIVHLLRYSLQFASWKERKVIAKVLRAVYAAASAEAVAGELTAFEAGLWGEKYPAIAQSWRRNWDEVIPFFAFSPEVRKIIYTTNAIESLHSQVRKTIRHKGHFPQRPCGNQAHLPGAARHRGQVETSAHRVRGKLPRSTYQVPLRVPDILVLKVSQKTTIAALFIKNSPMMNKLKCLSCQL